MARVSKESPQLWHPRFGHLGYDNLARLQTKDMVTGIATTANDFKAAGAGPPCEPCALGKAQRAPFKASGDSAASSKLELLHTDVCGPLPVDGRYLQRQQECSKFALEAALNRSGVEEHIPGIYLGYS